MRRPAIIVLAATAASLAACMHITVVAEEGLVRQDWRLGTLRLHVEPRGGGSLISATGLGVVQAGAHTTIGWSRSHLTLLDDTCRAVFWVADENAVAAIAAKLRTELPEACTFPTYRSLER